jgi:hypothetical protein
MSSKNANGIRRLFSSWHIHMNIILFSTI